MNFDTRFRLTQWLIRAVFVLILCFWIGAGVMVYKTARTVADQDWSGGVKPVVEQLWCGKPGCLNHPPESSK